jgi:hypothetical protein
VPVASLLATTSWGTSPATSGPEKCTRKTVRATGGVVVESMERVTDTGGMMLPEVAGMAALSAAARVAASAVTGMQVAVV